MLAWTRPHVPAPCSPRAIIILYDAYERQAGTFFPFFQLYGRYLLVRRLFFLFLLKSLPGTGYLLHRFCLIPILPHLQLDPDWHIQLSHTFHHSLYQAFGTFEFFYGYLEDEFVVDLEDHAGLQVSFFDDVVQADHGDFNQVGVGPLNRHVDGFTFDCLAFIGGERKDVWQETFAAKKCVDVALSASLVECTVNVTFDAREGFVVVLDE